GHSNDGSSGDPAQQGLVAALVQGTARTNHVQAGDMQMTFVHAPGADSGYVSAENLPALPAGKAYEAWFSKDGTEMEASTVFTSGHGTWIEAPGPIGQYVAMGFTIEDAGGAKAPTTAPFALISLNQTAYNYPG
ncbi:MAG: anti-sigma factor, partial [Tepidiformaceae bacterium]